MRKVILVILILVTSCSPKPAQREVITTDKAPKAIGPYSQAIKIGGRIYVAGQIGIDPERKGLAEGIEAQTHQALMNVKHILEAGDFTMDNVVQVQVFLKNIEDYKLVNSIYSTYFNDSKPARAAVEVSKIPADALIEIMVVAEK